MANRFIRLPEVEKRTSLKRSSIYARMDAKSPYFDATFPRPVPLGGRTVGWVEAEIDEWVEARINARQAA